MRLKIQMNIMSLLKTSLLRYSLYPPHFYYWVTYLSTRTMQKESTDGFKVGKRLNIQETAKRISDRLKEPGRSARVKLDNTLKNAPLQPANSNIESNTFAGATVTLVVYALESYLPGKAGANTEVINVEVDGDVERYTINTNAPLEGQARFRSILDSSTGLTSLYTDEIEVEDFEVLHERPGRDTYRYVITVKA
jgi:hypothetical protein